MICRGVYYNKQLSRMFLKRPAVCRSLHSKKATQLNFQSENEVEAEINTIGKEDSNGLKLAVLLLNLGGPESMGDVEGFLYNLFADPDIIRLPSFLSLLQKPIAYIIAKRRAPKSSEAYRSIGGGSPIVKYTQEQADLIQKRIVEKFGLPTDNAKVYFAMRYWNPYTEEVLSQYSISTSGSSLKLLEEIFYKDSSVWGPHAEYKVSHTVVPSWYYRPGYVRVMAKLILEQLLEFSIEEMREGVHVLFSAHGVPQSYIEAGDPYQRQIEECVRLISRAVSKQLQALDDKQNKHSLSKPIAMALAGAAQTADVFSPMTSSASSPPDASNVKEVQYHLSFQSRVGPVKWLQPYTEETLIDLGRKQQVKNLVVVPVSFVSEHIETLEEIDMEYKELAIENGIKHWRRVQALNTDEYFIDDMADLVMEALQSPALSVSEAVSGYSDFIENQSLGGGGSSSLGSGMVGGTKSNALTIDSRKRDETAPLGMTDSAEKMNGRFAMLGLLGTTLLEVLNNGHPMLSVLGIR
eukprot:gene23108-31425_t